MPITTSRPYAAKDYRKIPVVIQAAQWNGPGRGVSVEALQGWGCYVMPTQFWSVDGHPQQHDLIIATLEDGVEGGAQVEHVASVGDYIICGVLGEFYPCKAAAFEQTYEPLEPHDPNPFASVPHPSYAAVKAHIERGTSDMERSLAEQAETTP